jgi:hypothetical protein
VDVGFDHVVDVEAPLLRVLQVTGDVSLWVDDDGASRDLVADEIGGVREASQEVLLEDDLTTSLCRAQSQTIEPCAVASAARSSGVGRQAALHYSVMCARL